MLIINIFNIHYFVIFASLEVYFVCDKIGNMNDSCIRDALAKDRTHLANERTFLAYLRTSLALMASGFFLIKFIDGSTIFMILGFLIVASGVALFIYGMNRFSFFKNKIDKTKD